jgi:hypothetical protein
MKTNELKLDNFLSDSLNRKQASSVFGGMNGDPIKPPTGGGGGGGPTGPGGTTTSDPIGDPTNPVGTIIDPT